MAWVRIDDAALSHPKIIGMVDTRRPFDLWMWGLSYAQLHLTDGLIPSDAVPKFASKAAHELCRRGLWEASNAGFAIHDFLHWNDSRELVMQRREAAEAERQVSRDRLKRWRDAKKDKRNASGNARETPLHETFQKRSRNGPETLLTKPNQTLVQKDPTASSLSAPTPIRGSEHGRIFLHRWQIESLISTLGPNTETFDLDAWVFNLSQVADSKGLVLEKKMVWPWVQAQFSEEIRRRGLPTAGDEPDDSLARMRQEIERQNAMVRRA